MMKKNKTIIPIFHQSKYILIFQSFILINTYVWFIIKQLDLFHETIIFKNLTRAQLGQIVDIQIQRLADRLAAMNLKLQLSEQARDFLAEKGHDPIYGARPLKRAIQKYIENPLSMEIIQGSIAEGSTIEADVQGEQIIFNHISHEENQTAK